MHRAHKSNFWLISPKVLSLKAAIPVCLRILQRHPVSPGQPTEWLGIIGTLDFRHVPVEDRRVRTCLSVKGCLKYKEIIISFLKTWYKYISFIFFCRVLLFGSKFAILLVPDFDQGNKKCQCFYSTLISSKYHVVLKDRCIYFLLQMPQIIVIKDWTTRNLAAARSTKLRTSSSTLTYCAPGK